MKTKNNIRKTALQIAAAATGIAILSFTVNAQETFKSFFETTGINHYAMVTESAHNSMFSGNHISNNTNTETYAAYLVTESEEPMNLEAWMTNENTFDGYTSSLEPETEKEMAIEIWMMDENSFTSTLNNEAETENPLQVESWMTDGNNFNSLLALIETEIETELVKENWMLTENIFGNNELEAKTVKTEAQPISTATFFYREVNNEVKLEVESWMLNADVLGK